MPRSRELAELATSYDSGGLSNMRNRIINGNMVIDQRNAGASVTPSVLYSTYTLDRWKTVYSVGSKFSVQRNAGSVTPPTGFTNYLGATSLSAYTPSSNETFQLLQSIEGFNVADLGWGAAGAQSVTLSFWVRSSLTGTFGLTISNSGVARSYVASYTISAANTWEYKTITIAGDTSGTWLKDNDAGMVLQFSLGAASNLLTTAGSWYAGGYYGVTGQTNIVGTNGATFYITGVQLEAGSVATPFERRDYGRELMMCQRYLFAYRSSSTSEYITFGQAAGTTIAVHNFAFPVTTRVPPTGVTVSSAGHFYPLNGSVSSAPGAASSVTFESGTTIGAQVRATVASGLTTGQGSYLYTVNASAVLYFTGCEL
jgi:hypothetical protein